MLIPSKGCTMQQVAIIVPPVHPLGFCGEYVTVAVLQ